MDKKTYTIFYSVLLASTFAHEIRARGKADSIFGLLGVHRHHHTHRRHHLHHGHYPKECRMVCPVPPKSVPINEPSRYPLILAHEEASLLGIVAGGVLFIIDVKSQCIGLLLGSTKEMVIIRSEAGEGVFIPAGVLQNTENVTSYFRTFTSLEYFLTMEGATPFKVGMAPDDVLTFCNHMLPSLMTDVAEAIPIDMGAGLNTLTSIGIGLLKSLSGSSDKFFSMIGTEVIQSKWDLAGTFSYIRGLHHVCGHVPGGLKGIIRPGSPRLSKLIKEENGIGRLHNVMLMCLEGKRDVLLSLALLLNDPLSLMRIIAKFDGTNNIYKVIANLILFCHGNHPLEILVYTILQFLCFLHEHPVTYHLQPALTRSWPKLKATIIKFGLSIEFDGCIKTFDALHKGTFIIKNVNISEIIIIINELVTANKLTPQLIFKCLVTIIMKLHQLVDHKIGVPKCLLTILACLNGITGMKLMRVLGLAPEDLTLPELLKNKVDFFSRPMHDFFGFYTGNMYKALSSMPVAGRICHGFNSAVAEHKVTELNVLFNNNTVANQEIKTFFQVKCGTDLGATKEEVHKTEGLVETCTSHAGYWEVVPTDHISVPTDAEI